MDKDYRAVAAAVDKGAGAFKQANAGAADAFARMGQAAYRPGALDRRTKELMALAISISARCDGCVAYHARAAFKAGATRDEVAETVAVAIQMGGGPSMVYGADALQAYDAFASEAGPPA
jgi:AhpD family alkylhydroperoxidase